MTVINRSTTDKLSIGELAARTGVSARTIRYYEELGILPDPPRTDGGTRRYTEDHVRQVQGVLALKGLRFDLEEIAELSASALRGSRASERAQEILQAKVLELREHLALLEQLQAPVSRARTA